MREDLSHDVQAGQKAGHTGPRRLSVPAGDDAALGSDPVRGTESRPPERRIGTTGALGLSVVALTPWASQDHSVACGSCWAG